MDLLRVGAALLMAGAIVQLLVGVLAAFLGFPVGIVGLSARSDQRMWGRSSADLLRDPVVRGLRTHHTIVLGGLVTGLGVLQVFVVWFAIRAGEAWAVLAMTLMGLPMMAWWFAMVGQFWRAGVRVVLWDVQPFVWVHAVLWAPGIVLCWVAVWAPA